LLGEILNQSLVKIQEVAKKLSPRFIEEKKEQLIEIEEMSLARNGDMIRPQVKAVMDMLKSGIEIDSDFSKG
jgi:hypothetical protein